MPRPTIDAKRLWSSLMELAKIGATPKGGVRRVTLTEADREGRERFAQWCGEAGLQVRVDAIGNMFARRAGREPDAAPVVMGSHLDTQPNGGRFDGAYGVMAGLEVMRALNDARMSTHAPPGWHLDPRLADDTVPVRALALCELRLMNDANYPWLVLVPRVAAARELIDLGAEQRRQLSDEIDLASRLLRDAFRPFKLNVAALGNLVPQLHVHVIARYEGDPAWPAPVWGRVAARPYEPEALVERISRLREALPR